MLSLSRSSIRRTERRRLRGRASFDPRALSVADLQPTVSRRHDAAAPRRLAFEGE